MLALYGIKIHNLARVVVGPFCISVWLWGESYKSFLTRNWKLLTLVLSFMREHGFQALAASVARFLLDKIYDYRCVTINLNFVLKQ